MAGKSTYRLTRAELGIFQQALFYRGASEAAPGDTESLHDNEYTVVRAALLSQMVRDRTHTGADEDEFTVRLKRKHRDLGIEALNFVANHPDWVAIEATSVLEKMIEVRDPADVDRRFLSIRTGEAALKLAFESTQLAVKLQQA